MKWGELVDFIELDLTIEHTQRVVCIASLSYGSQLLFGTLLSWLTALFKAVVGQIVVQTSVLSDQFFDLSLLNLGCGMGSAWYLHLLARAHVEERLVELASLVRGEVHIFAMLHEIIERLFLWNKSFGWL